MKFRVFVCILVFDVVLRGEVIGRVVVGLSFDKEADGSQKYGLIMSLAMTTIKIQRFQFFGKSYSLIY